MSKIYFEKFIGKGEAISPLDQSVNKWLTVELSERNGMLRSRVKVNFWEKEVSSIEEIEKMVPGANFTDGSIKTVAIENGFDINGTLVYSATVFVPASTTLAAVLTKKFGVQEPAALAEDAVIN